MASGPGGSMAAAKANADKAKADKDKTAGGTKSGPAGPGGSVAAAKANAAPDKPTDGDSRARGPGGSIAAAKTNTGDTEADMDKRAANYDAAQRDFKGTDDSTSDSFWNGVANFFGIREEDPTAAPAGSSPLMTGNADWGADTAGILGGLAGGALMPGLGLLTGPIAGAINDELGRPIPDINLGQLDSKPVNTPSSTGLAAGTDISGGDTSNDPGDATGDNPDRTGAADTPGSTQDTTGADQNVAKPSTKANTAVDDSTPDTILPQTGIGISIPTQTSGEGSSVYVGTADQRRRRGTLGGLGRGGLAL